MLFHFATLQRAVEVNGVGLHTGQKARATLKPTDRAGVQFVRLDLPGAPRVSADEHNVSSTTHATTLQEGIARALTTEHLLAALWASGITHCEVELNAPEVPILDGSARPWCDAIAKAGTRELSETRPTLELRESVWIEQERASVIGVPAPDFRLTVAVDFDAPHARAQVFDGTVTPQTFADEIAGARTFTLQQWLEPLRLADLIQGGSLDNAILIDDKGWSSPPRFSNELARHKALDVIGDLALLFGASNFRGHIIATRAGHGAHRAWMEACRASDALQIASM